MSTDDATTEVDDLRLAVTVARRHYLGDESKSDIARSLGVSRFKVARLLDLAKTAGLIRIEIDEPPAAPSQLRDELHQRYPGLRRVAISSGPGARSGGNVAGPLLESMISSDDVLGLPWARAVHYAVQAIGSLPRIPVVQLCGSLVIDGESTATDMVRLAAGVSGGSSHVFHAPLIMPTASGAGAVRRQPDVARALAAAETVTIALASVGSWNATASTVHDALGPEDRAAATEAGVVGETMGVLFDRHGQPVQIPLAERIVTIAPAQFSNLPQIVLMSRGRSRLKATQALLNQPHVSGLVVDIELATALLEDPRT